MAHPGVIWIISSGNVPVFSTIDNWKGNLSLFFCIQFFRQCVSIALQQALTSAIERKIALAGDAYSKPPNIIRFHDLHANNIERVMGEIISYHKRD
jgi:hypothetical protein